MGVSRFVRVRNPPVHRADTHEHYFRQVGPANSYCRQRCSGALVVGGQGDSDGLGRSTRGWLRPRAAVRVNDRVRSSSWQIVARTDLNFGASASQFRSTFKLRLRFISADDNILTYAAGAQQGVSVVSLSNVFSHYGWR